MKRRSLFALATSTLFSLFAWAQKQPIPAGTISYANKASRLANGIWFAVHGVSGPWVVLLHGFPSSGHDWDEIVAAMAVNHRVLVHDMLGYGRSLKPMDGNYSVRAHLDRLLDLCAHLQIHRAAFVGHDLGAILLQQLIYRSATQHSILALTGVAFMNSSLYHHLYRPTLIQKILLLPVLGTWVAKRANEETFIDSIRKVWGPKPPASSLLSAMWQHYSRDNGHLLTPLHLQYIQEREEGGDTWMPFVERLDVPVAFIWGIHDPVSGKAVLDYAKQRFRHASFVELDAGHFPPLEQPLAVQSALGSWLETVKRQSFGK
jgi:pimeloyl-ACP methyl ester carboxylesterase